MTKTASILDPRSRTAFLALVCKTEGHAHGDTDDEIVACALAYNARARGAA